MTVTKVGENQTHLVVRLCKVKGVARPKGQL